MKKSLGHGFKSLIVGLSLPTLIVLSHLYLPESKLVLPKRFIAEAKVESSKKKAKKKKEEVKDVVDNDQNDLVLKKLNPKGDANKKEEESIDEELAKLEEKPKVEVKPVEVKAPEKVIEWPLGQEYEKVTPEMRALVEKAEAEEKAKAKEKTVVVIKPEEKKEEPKKVEEPKKIEEPAKPSVEEQLAEMKKEQEAASADLMKVIQALMMQNQFLNQMIERFLFSHQQENREIGYDFSRTEPTAAGEVHSLEFIPYILDTKSFREPLPIAEHSMGAPHVDSGNRLSAENQIAYTGFIDAPNILIPPIGLSK